MNKFIKYFKVLYDIGIYGFGIIIPRFGIFLLMSTLTRILSPDSYGMIDISTNITGVLGIAVGSQSS